MTTYTTYEIRSGVFAIEEGAVRMYLIVGSREALLLDTGSGAGDLRGLVRGLTALPVTVALTHGHNDHTGGAPQFGTAYAHKNDWPEIRSDLGENAVTLRELRGGDVFDLGGRLIEVVETAGHTPGSLSFFDRKNRLLFTGDNVSDRPIFMCLPGADMALIDRAVDYANRKHKVQKRKDGSPYIIHPLAVAQIVAEMGLDCDAILGALLHDCIEDTDASHEDIEKIFGPTVAELVEGVTKLTRANFSSSEQAQMENLRKMFMAMSKDIRVVLIKIADRLHNMRTMQYQTPEKQIQKCRETMDVYAPLAHRLGMQKIKWELEDTSLRYLAPMEYNEIMSYLQAHKEKDEAFMRTIQDKITQRLTSVGIHNTTYGRIKHVYSIYRKMLAQGKTIDELYDIYAFRVIVDTIPDCYNVLGHVHDLFSLVPGRFKDYISTPKPNMYQSLHTTVIGSQGIPFEVQIRTWQMHETAEYGIAAHWKYKQGTGTGTEKDFEWVRRLLESQQDSDAEEFVQSMKIDMFDDEVFVYTPKGRIVSLPAGSTPIDFAYAIHSGVGNSMIGAKVNNRIANIDTTLKNGDIVEVLTSKSAKGPSRVWLTI